MKPLFLTVKENEQRQAYAEARPEAFGNLHERMKWLLEKLDVIWPQQKLDALNGMDEMVALSALANAIFDLETEVAPYAPVDPPYGERVSSGGVLYHLKKKFPVKQRRRAKRVIAVRVKP